MSRRHKASKLVKKFHHAKRVTWESKDTLRHVGTKLMCVECTQASGEPALKAVVDFKPMARLAVLECGHERPATTLPSSMLRPELTPEEREAAERCVDAGETTEALVKLDQELEDFVLKQMEEQQEIVVLDGGVF